MAQQGNILLTIPDLKAQGGVAAIYNATLPYLKDRVDTLEVGSIKGDGGIFHSLNDQLRFQNNVKCLNSSLVHLNPSLNFQSFIRDGLFAWQASHNQIPFIVFWHGWDKEFAETVRKRLLFFFRTSFARADAHIVLASEFKMTLRRWGVKSPILLGTSTVDNRLIEKFNLQSKITSIKNESRIKILFLARLERAKGVFETVRALRLLIDNCISAQLTIAGDGNIRQELEAFTHSLQLTDQQVHFTGYIRGENKVKAFTEHHIYCLPSYGEGLPTSVLEAMAFGIPVLTRPVGGLADIFEDGKMGRLIQGKNPEEIAVALEQMINDRDKLAEISRYNAEYARKHFMASTVAKRLKKIYEEMVRR